MTTSKTFDKDRWVKEMTETGLALPLAEAVADECAQLAALGRSETADAGTFEKEQCVQRLTGAGFALPTAEAVADMFADADALLRGQRHAPPTRQ